MSARKITLLRKYQVEENKNLNRCGDYEYAVMGSFTNYVNRLGGVSKMFILLYNPYLINWFTSEEGGVKKGQNLVHIVCERPLILQHAQQIPKLFGIWPPFIKNLLQASVFAEDKFFFSFLKTISKDVFPIHNYSEKKICSNFSLI